MLNPAGAPGVYILPSTGLGTLCRPSVHDTRLNQKISMLPAITPASVRDAAREVAASGLAGREAMATARAIAEAEQRDRAQIEAALLAALGGRLGVFAPEPVDATQMTARLAQCVGTDPRSLEASLDILVEGLLLVGLPGRLPPGASPARATRLLERLSSLCLDLNLWLCGSSADTNSDLADIIIAAAEQAKSSAGTTLAAARALTADPLGLVRAIAKAPEPIMDCLNRPEWLLDGWEAVYGLWQCAEGPAERHATLVQMARILPGLPREAAQWIAAPGEGHATHRRIGLDARLRSEAINRSLAARNERLRALTI
jgi:hypothetical protein